MIRISRGAEPDSLKEVRRVELPRVRDALAAGEALTRELLKAKFRVAGEYLWKAQHHKCCYCEVIVAKRGNDVEHFRPAVSVQKTSERGYWWLAWNWDNLLFSCPACNRYEKNDLFPLANPSQRIQPEAQPPGGEIPLLLDPADPAAADPVDSIVFRRELGHWVPGARRGSVEGAETVKVLGLDYQDLLDLYDDHYDRMRAAIEAMEQAISAANQTRIKADWDVLVRHVKAECLFSHLAFDIVDHHFPQATRARYGLTLFKPS